MRFRRLTATAALVLLAGAIAALVVTASRAFPRGLIMAAMLALSACGFKLRGTGPQPILPFKTLFVSVAETSPLGVQLRRTGAGCFT